MSNERVDPDKRTSLLGCLMEFAFILRDRSTCKRLQVGALVVTPDFEQILSYGYNGNARGLINCCDSEEQGECGCVHAEMNALIKASHPQNQVLITTHSPCMLCAKCIINARILAVYFQEWYRDREPSKMLSHKVIGGLWEYDPETDRTRRINP